MSNFHYQKHSCHKERERDYNVKHCVRSPHRYTTQVNDHEKCVRKLSNLNLHQGSISSRSSCKPLSSAKGAEVCCRNESKVCHKSSGRSAANVAASQKNGETSRSKGNLCYPLPRSNHSTARCNDDFVWQKGRYVKDECGSGIVPLRMDASDPKRVWCKTPLTMYQSTIGELARQMLCNEVAVRKRVNVGPPCNLCEHVMPLCKGYYRKYECRRNCEEEHAVVKDGKKVYRDPIQQYWKPCLTAEEKREYDLSKDADHNVYLGKKLKRKIGENVVCW